MRGLAPLLALLALSATALAWSWPAHVVIYMIARNELGWDELDFVDELIDEVKDPSANYPNVFEVAAWADEVRSQDNALYGTESHFFNQLYCDGVPPKSVRAKTDYQHNVVQAVTESLKTLKSKSSSRENKSYMMRYLIHMVGDMHQPLHMSTRCTPNKLLCDKGGNSFSVNAGPKTQNLHALWDQAMKEIPYSRRPLNKASIDLYKDFAKNIAREYPKDKLRTELGVTDLLEIARSLYDIAVKYAYTDIQENKEPSSEYLRSRYEVCKKLIALAGYRLADHIEEVYRGNSS